MSRTAAVLAFLLSCLASAGLLVVGPRIMSPLMPPTEFVESGAFAGDGRDAAAELIAVATENPPRLVLERTRINAGEMLRGEPARFVFPLRNEGPGPLVIAAQASCGCTLVHHEREVRAGAVSELTAELDTSKLQGLVTKSIDVQTNDPRRPRLRLELVAQVVSAVTILPADDPTVSLRVQGETVHELQLVTAATESVEVTGVQCNESYVSAELDPTAEEAGRRTYRLTLRFGTAAPLGRSDVHLTVATTAKHEPQIPFTVRCEKGIIVSPAIVHVRQAADDQRFPPAQVMISKREGNLQIASAAGSDPSWEVQVQPIKAGSAYRLSIAFPGAGSSLPTPANIAVETNDPEQPRLEIPVRFLEAPRP